jgi:hypothetical protein
VGFGYGLGRPPVWFFILLFCRGTEGRGLGGLKNGVGYAMCVVGMGPVSLGLDFELDWRGNS